MWYIESKNITTFNIIWKCNLSCPYCSWYPKVEFSLDNIKDNIKWLEEISLQWWEPTLSPYLDEIIAFARENWTKYINLITNGIKIADYEFAKNLKWKIDCYHFSFASHINGVSDKLWWSTKILLNKTKAILNLMRLWEVKKIRLVYIIQKENINDIAGLPIFINKYFPWLNLIELKYLQYFWNNNNIWNIPSYSESYNQINKTLLICEKLKINFIINGIPLCFLKERFHKYTSNFHNNNNETIMSQYSTIKLDKCIKCKYNEKCIWIRQDYIKLIWDDEFR